MVRLTALLMALGFAAIASTSLALRRPRPNVCPQLSKNRASVPSRSIRQTQSSEWMAVENNYTHECSLRLLRGGATEKQGTTLAGNLFPFLSKFAVSKSDLVSIYNELAETVDLWEFALIALFAWGLVPFLQSCYNIWERAINAAKKGDHQQQNFKDTILYKPAVHMSQAAVIGVFIYVVDCIAVVMNELGFKYFRKVGFSRKAANLAFFAWLSSRLMRLKRSAVYRTCGTAKPHQVERAKLYNRILDIFLTVLTAVVIIEKLDVDFGVSLKSLFAFGGMGGLVLSLATKDLAGQLVNGVAVTASERFFVGDKVKFGDGTKGTVEKIGLLYTEIRGADDIVVKIPNSQIANQRTSNISRVDKCQVKQTLRFMYEDIHKLPAIIASIKEEIIKSCPALITDGSRPFRVHWREFQADHLEVVVDSHFNLPAKGTVYWDNRQAVLEAISRAIAKNGVTFAIPSSLAKNMDYVVQSKRPSPRSSKATE